MFSGGGTVGSITPLLAIAEELVREAKDFDQKNGRLDLKLYFVGTTNDLEKEVITAFNNKMKDIVPDQELVMKFIPLISGKWRRYFSWKNFLDIFKIAVAFFESLIILTKERPEIVISAGSFVSVPLVFAAALKKIPVLIHQQDVRPGLANKLMAPYARAITVTFENSLMDYGPRAIWTGNPVGDLEKYENQLQEIKAEYDLNPDKPLLLVMGGGTGAMKINEIIFAAAPRLVDYCQIIHLTGKGKLPSTAKEIVSNNYQVFEFLYNDKLLPLMVAADLVISRCGLGALTELAALGKASILIPMPDSHQEDNAAVFSQSESAIVLNQNELTPEKLIAEIESVLENSDLKTKLQNNIIKIIKRGAAESVSSIIWEIVGK